MRQAPGTISKYRLHRRSIFAWNESSAFSTPPKLTSRGAGSLDAEADRALGSYEPSTLPKRRAFRTRLPARLRSSPYRRARAGSDQTSLMRSS